MTGSPRGASLGLIVGVSALLVLITALIVGFLPIVPTSGKEAGAAIALVGSIAVGIERVQELFWSLVDFNVGPGWPFGILTRPIRDLTTQVGSVLPSYFTQANEFLTKTRAEGTLAQEKLASLEADLISAQEQLGKLNQGLPADSAARGFVSSFTSRLQRIQGVLPVGDAVVSTGQGAIDILDNLLAKMQSNPGRRSIGMLAGTILGMIICAVLDVDMLSAIFGATYSGFQLGIVATGILVGLGADPTHQVIRLLEEAKNQLKSQSPTPTS
jgi:hypothetical protein